MRAARRVLLVVVVALATLTVLGWVVVHLPAVQRRAWAEVVEVVEAATGVRLEADSIRLRMVPARVEARGLAVGTGGETPLTVDRLQVRFRWRHLLGSARSIDVVEIEGLEMDLRHLELPTRGAQPEQSTEPGLWRALEIGELRLRGGRIVAATGAFGLDLDRLSIAGAVSDGSATVTIEAGNVQIDREGRMLEIGEATVDCQASQAGVAVERLTIAGDALRLVASGDVGIAPVISGRGSAQAVADVAAVVGWWDPDLAADLAPIGELALSASVAYDPDVGLRLTVEQRGSAVGIAGYRLDGLEIEHDAGISRARLDIDGTSSVEVSSLQTGRYGVVANLSDFGIDGLLARISHPATASLPRGLTVDGRVEGSFPVPVELAEVATAGRLVLRWPDGRVTVAAEGGGRQWLVPELEFELPGAKGSGRGEVAGDRFSADLRLDIGDPRMAAEYASAWFGTVGAVGIEGGPLWLELSAQGPLTTPAIEARAVWTAPRLGGLTAEEARASVSGTLEDVGWTVEVEPRPNSLMHLEGRTLGRSLVTTGRWAVRVPDLAALATAAEIVPVGATGGFVGSGEFSWSPDGWRVDGSVSASGLGAGSWVVDEASGSFVLDPGGASVTDVRARLGTGEARLDGRLVPLALDGVIEASISVEGLDLADLDVGDLAVGTVSVAARVDGTVSEPGVTADIDWDHGRDQAIADPLRLHLRVAEGMIDAFTEHWQTAAGPINAKASVPLGSLPKPEWLWPAAPKGPIRARLTGVGLRSGPVVAAFGRNPLPGEVAGDVAVDVAWDLLDPTARLALLSIDGLTIKGEHMDLTSERTVRARLRDNRFEVESASLAGPRSHVNFGGTYDLSSNRLVGAADLDLSARIVEMLPFPIQANGPIRVQIAVDGPLETPTATLAVDHDGGSIVMREPAVAITDLRLRVEVKRGIVWIQDGEAGLNQGHVLMGGGWDPVSGQGVVFELEDVKALLGTSIVTSWSGAVAVEPDPNFAARVVGELGLDAGVWERPFDLKAAFLGSDDPDADEEDPLAAIALDLQVTGYGGIKVDNNLGRFDANWGILEVGGTLAGPELIGTVRLAPGGTVNLPGQSVVIRRATIDFTGNPETDPLMEIIPEQFSVGLGGAGGEGNRLDTRTLAAETLARGAGSVLGLENTTLQPAEVAFETQTDASSAFTAGQRLTRNVAVFLTTDLSDVQSQTTMLQLWNLRGLPGLAAQGYTKTGEGEQGANLIERYRWGGSTADDDRPVIQKIKFAGDWPVSKRRLSRTTGLRKGEPYEPFLLFAAGLRLESALAERGYLRARVSAEAVGDPALPALVFSVDQGPRQQVTFTGDPVPTHIQRTATGLYREPPFVESSLREMRRAVLRHLLGEGFPDAVVTIEKTGDTIIVDSQRGSRVTLVGPAVEGLSGDDAKGLIEQTRSPLMLAEMVRDREWAGRQVERTLRVEGFPAARLENLWLSDQEDGAKLVHLSVEPGPRQRVAQVQVVGVDPLGLVSGGIQGIEVGMPLDRRRIGHALSRVRSSYRAAGYSEVEISSSLEGDETADMRLVVNLEPGPRRRLRRVEVTGLRHIRDSVILGGLAVEPGEVLLPSDLDTSAARTAHFAPVERANIRTQDVGVDLVDVTIEVTEKPRWMAEAGAGWSTERGASLQFGLRDDGLLGRGAGVSLRGLWDERQQQAAVYAALPPLPGGRWSSVANFSWFDGDSRISPDDFRQRQIGAAIESTYTITDTTSVRGYLRRQRTFTEVKDPDDYPPGFAPDPTTDDETILGSQLIWDRLDNPFDPRRGSYAALDLSHNAPRLGSDLNDLRVVLTGSLVTEPAPGWTWAQTVRMGGLEPLGDTISSPNRKFQAGGQATVRGFDLNSIGPIIPAEGGFRTEGGDALFVLNEEMRIPVFAKIRAALFVDVGQVWRSWSAATLDFSVGAGFGLRLATPVGPLWADVAWPVANPNISSPGAKYYFGLGTNF